MAHSIRKWSHGHPTPRQDVVINGVTLQLLTEIPDQQETNWINDEVFLLPSNLGPIKTLDMPRHPMMK